jgi:hypothetical protein
MEGTLVFQTLARLNKSTILKIKVTFYTEHSVHFLALKSALLGFYIMFINNCFGDENTKISQCCIDSLNLHYFLNTQLIFHVKIPIFFLFYNSCIWMRIYT